MLTLITSLCIIIPALAFVHLNVASGIIILILEIILLCLIPVFIKAQKQEIASKIKENMITEPILNINKAPWYLFVELPEISQFEAKKMVHMRRKYGKYTSLEDFYIKNSITEDKKRKIEKYIFV